MCDPVTRGADVSRSGERTLRRIATLRGRRPMDVERTHRGDEQEPYGSKHVKTEHTNEDTGGLSTV